MSEVPATGGATGPSTTGMPRNVVVVLLDSLNRHMIGAYGGAEFSTPNLDRFARERAVRFTSHVTGSLPCMPARHDILCGALDFLWKPWGSIEAWEDPITFDLRRAGVTTMLVTDHPHLFEHGGENYHADFSAWEYLRGHEGDPWRTRPDTSSIGSPLVPARSAKWMNGVERHMPYTESRTYFRGEDDFPGPKTMRVAADWLRTIAPHHDRFMLFVDEFDPHEPFDTPKPWAGMYDPEWDSEQIIWPPYDVGAIAEGRLTEREGVQVRANYGSKLSMIDHWFGQILDSMDAANLWDDTALIVCTDHGHYLGEKREGNDIWGKPSVPQFEPLGHTPLMIHWPGQAAASAPGSTCDALTTNVDLFATLADIFAVKPAHRTHGVSLVPLLNGASTSVREWAIGGVFGNWIQVTDGQRKYARGSSGDQFPLSMWSNRLSTMPIHGFPGIRLPRPDQRAFIDFMPGSNVPVLRQPFAPGDMLPFWVGKSSVDKHYCFDLGIDPDETENRVGSGSETEMLDLLREALRALEAPTEQLQRIGIS